MKTLVVLIGPTGVGKTELSLAVAKLLSSDIISADSRQIYDTLHIGTASPTAEQLAQARHHFVGTLSLDQYYSAAQYEADVMELLDDYFLTHDYALLTGGSMMYVDAVTKGIDDIPTVDEGVRATLADRLDKEGLAPLLEELRVLDPQHYEVVDRCNPKRVVHALEVCYTTGKTFTSFRSNKAKERPFRIVKFGLRRERGELFNRINMRVDEMMKDGLLEEARQVYHLRHLNSLNTVGYKEMFRHISGEWPLDMAVERLKKNTRVYAKKQMTWFKKDDSIIWLDADKCTKEELLEIIKAKIFLEADKNV